MAKAPDAYAQRLLAERARREAARQALASAPKREPQIGMPSKLGQMVSRQPSPDRVGQVRQAITQGVDYAGNVLMQGRAPEIGGVVRQMVEPVAQFPVTAVTDPLKAANQAQQVLDPAYAMARGLTTTRLGAEAGNPGEMAAGVTEMGLAGLSFIPAGAVAKGARAMPPARLPEIPQPRNVLAQAKETAAQPRNVLATAPEPIRKAQAEGYQGANIGEAQEWVSARSKGLDMSQPARMQRAQELGFDTRYKLFHATDSDFNQFDVEKIRSDLNLGEDAIFLTDSPAVADSYLGGAYVQRDAPKIIEKNVQGVDIGGGVGRYYSKNSAVYPLYAKNLNEYEVWDMGGGSYDPVFMQRAIKEAKQNGAPGIILQRVRDPGIMDTVGPQGNPRTPATVVAVFNPKDVRSVNAAFDPAKTSSANILATPPELGGAFVGGALGGTQGETPEERARNALLGAAGGAIGGRLASRAAIDRTRMGSNLGNISQAAPESEWVRAQKKGLDLSEEGRLARARDMGADVTQWEAALTQRNSKLTEADQLHTEAQLATTNRYYETLAKGEEIIDADYEAAIKAATDAADAEYQAAEDAANAAYYEAMDASESDAAEQAALRVFNATTEKADALREKMISKAEEKADAAKEKALERLEAKATKQQENEDERLNEWLDNENDTIEEEYNDMILDLEVILSNGQRRAAYNAAFDPDEMSSANILAGVGAVGAGAAMMPREAEAQTVGSERRPDGTKKGLGYFGEIPITFPNGDTGVATEYSTQSQAVKVDGKMIDFPTLVPTLTPDEVRIMATDIIPNRKPIPETIMQKAIAHARKRLAAGQSVYADQKKPPGNKPRG